MVLCLGPYGGPWGGGLFRLSEVTLQGPRGGRGGRGGARLMYRGGCG